MDSNKKKKTKRIIGDFVYPTQRKQSRADGQQGKIGYKNEGRINKKMILVRFRVILIFI